MAVVVRVRYAAFNFISLGIDLVPAPRARVLVASLGSPGWLLLLVGTWRGGGAPPWWLVWGGERLTIKSVARDAADGFDTNLVSISIALR